MARCIKCKTEFDQNGGGSRNCGCAKYSPVPSDSKYWRDSSRYFQDPIYQYLRLDNSENLSCEMRYVRPHIMVISKIKRKVLSRLKLMELMLKSILQK